MKTQLIHICICVAALQTVSAKTWEPRTHECALEFPNGIWTFQEGGEISHGQIILSAANREQDKAVDVLRYDVATSISVQDPRFVQGLKEGFAKTGSRLLSNGYTNVNGRNAYWFTGEKLVNGHKVSTLRYGLCENGRLYQLIAERLGDSPLDDNELLAILNSFKILGKVSPPLKPFSDANSLSYKIGFVTGSLLGIILIVGIVMRQVRKRSDTQKQRQGKSTVGPNNRLHRVREAQSGRVNHDKLEGGHRAG